MVEINPDRTRGLRIPEAGRMAIEVHDMPVFDLTVIPFVWTTIATSWAEGMVADPKGHEMLWHTNILLPIGDIEVTAYETVMSSSNDAFMLHDETRGGYE